LFSRTKGELIGIIISLDWRHITIENSILLILQHLSRCVNILINIIWTRVPI
jgi:hypothetical protein